MRSNSSTQQGVKSLNQQCAHQHSRVLSLPVSDKLLAEKGADGTDDCPWADPGGGGGGPPFWATL